MTKLRSILLSLSTISSLLVLLCINAAGKDLLEYPLKDLMKEDTNGIPYIDAESMISSFNIRVTVSKTSDIYTYDYTFSNPATSTGMIEVVGIVNQKPRGSVELSKEDLAKGPCLDFDDEILEDNQELNELSPQEKEKFRVTPVGVTSPSSWECFYATTTLTPLASDLNVQTILGWWTGGEEIGGGNYILPGQSLSGFQLKSRGLPTIRWFNASPFIDPRVVSGWLDELGIDYDRGPEIKGTQGRTLGPTSPPANFDPLVFIKTIHEYLAESQKLKWLKDNALAAKLKGYLDNTAKAISTGNMNAAKQAVKAFIAVLPTPPAAIKTCTPECSGLLVFNAQYLLEQLSVKQTPKEGK